MLEITQCVGATIVPTSELETDSDLNYPTGCLQLYSSLLLSLSLLLATLSGGFLGSTAFFHLQKDWT